MKWLEQEREDATERWLGEVLKTARQRTGDEVARRRVWSRLEGLSSGKGLPARRGMSLALPGLVGVLVAVSVVAVLWMVPATRPTPSPVAAKRVAPAVASASQPGVVVPQVAPQVSSATPVRTGRKPARVALAGGAGVELDANSVLGWDAERRPSVERGQARFEVPHQAPGVRFAISAGPYVIAVVGTKFHVGVSDDRVSVEVEEGVVEVWRGARSVRLVEGDSWAGPMRGITSPTLGRRPSLAGASLLRRASSMDSPAPVTNGPGSVELTEARTALGEGRPEDALAKLTHCAKGVGPAAENAAYEMGRVLRDGLHRPQAAVAAWVAYRTRFPKGLLRTEADLSILETLARVGDKAAALSEAEAFLARYPNSERRDEVAKLAARVRGAP